MSSDQKLVQWTWVIHPFMKRTFLWHLLYTRCLRVLIPIYGAPPLLPSVP